MDTTPAPTLPHVYDVRFTTPPIAPKTWAKNNFWTVQAPSLEAALAGVREKQPQAVIMSAIHRGTIELVVP